MSESRRLVLKAAGLITGTKEYINEALNFGTFSSLRLTITALEMAIKDLHKAEDAWISHADLAEHNVGLDVY